MSVRACDIPRGGVLQAYVGQGATYTDCFEVVVPVIAPLPDFIEAFYTTWVFRLERVVLACVLRQRIRDADVTALAKGAEYFAVWTVEQRQDEQILLCDLGGHTRSYLAVSLQEGGATRLLFGSAVVAGEGQPLGRLVRWGTPLHRFYAKTLLRAAARKLRQS